VNIAEPRGKVGRLVQLEIVIQPEADVSFPRRLTIFLESFSSVPLKGECVARVRLHGAVLPAVVRNDRGLLFAFDPFRSMRAMLREKYCRLPRPVTSLLPFHYHRFPCEVRFRLGRLTTHASLAFNRGGFPRWPIEPSLESFRIFLSSLLRSGRDKPWSGKYAVAFTHDIDCAEGYRGARRLAEIDRDYGVRATWFVSCAPDVIDYDVLDELAAEGNEIACHGLRHDNKIAYLPADGIAARLALCAKQLSRYNPTGFRSPSMVRSENLFSVVERFFSYDSSVPDTDGLTGCCSVFPFRRGRLLEIPISMPLDASLLLRGYDAELALAVWRKKLQWVKTLGGLAVFTTHPEPHFSGRAEMRRAYERLVRMVVSDNGAKVLTLGEISPLFPLD